MLIGEVIPQLYEYLRSNPAAPERNEFEYILVDEFQDLNRAEQGVIQLLSDGASVCIVGDDDLFDLFIQARTPRRNSRLDYDQCRR
jgi:DNA helicase II / ATP-dependent DNA helicase PcrA